jgi:hypothetical protein
MLWRKRPEDIAKVGVEGSNPFARSRFLKEISSLEWPSGSVCASNPRIIDDGSRMEAVKEKSEDTLAKLWAGFVRPTSCACVTFSAGPADLVVCDDAETVPSLWANFGLACLLSYRSIAHDLLRRLILAQSQINDLPQQSVGRPAEIPHLSDELRLHPMDLGEPERGTGAALRGGGRSRGIVLISSGLSLPKRRSSSASFMPVPARPAKTKRPSSA